MASLNKPQYRIPSESVPPCESPKRTLKEIQQINDFEVSIIKCIPKCVKRDSSLYSRIVRRIKEEEYASCKKWSECNISTAFNTIITYRGMGEPPPLEAFIVAWAVHEGFKTSHRSKFMVVALNEGWMDWLEKKLARRDGDKEKQEKKKRKAEASNPVEVPLPPPTINPRDVPLLSIETVQTPQQQETAFSQPRFKQELVEPPAFTAPEPTPKRPRVEEPPRRTTADAGTQTAMEVPNLEKDVVKPLANIIDSALAGQSRELRNTFASCINEAIERAVTTEVSRQRNADMLRQSQESIAREREKPGSLMDMFGYRSFQPMGRRPY